MVEADLDASCKISFLSRISISSRFSARSDIVSVLLGSEASRKTNGRPDMYTVMQPLFSQCKDIRVQWTNREVLHA